MPAGDRLLTVAAFGGAAAAVVLVALGFGWIATPRVSLDAARAPFLAGVEPELHAWNRYHARYYPLSLLFRFGSPRRNIPLAPSVDMSRGTTRSRRLKTVACADGGANAATLQ